MNRRTDGIIAPVVAYLPSSILAEAEDEADLGGRESTFRRLSSSERTGAGGRMRLRAGGRADVDVVRTQNNVSTKL